MKGGDVKEQIWKIANSVDNISSAVRFLLDWSVHLLVELQKQLIRRNFKHIFTNIYTVSAFSFVPSPFGRIQIHREIWNFIEQYKSAYPGPVIRSRSTIDIHRFFATLFCGNLSKKEKEKSKRKEENGDRKITTLIS